MNDEKLLSRAGYMSAQEAAAVSGMTRDYIARLCRIGTLRGRREGKQWFVRENSLYDFLILNEYAHSKRRESLTTQRKTEYRGSFAIKPEHWRTAAESALAAGVVSRSDDKNSIARTMESLLNAPSGAAHAALQVAHVPIYTITPFMEIVHRLIALFCAVLVIFGAYTLVNPEGSLQAVKGTLALGSEVIEHSPEFFGSSAHAAISETASVSVGFQRLVSEAFNKLR